MFRGLTRAANHNGRKQVPECMLLESESLVLLQYSPLLRSIYMAITPFLHSCCQSLRRQQNAGLIELVRNLENKPRFTGRVARR